MDASLPPEPLPPEPLPPEPSPTVPSQTRPSLIDDPAIAAALRGWGLVAEQVEALRGGAANEHWRVAAGGQTLVLRRYHDRQSPASIDYEHRLLGFLATRDWPVASPVQAADGGTLVRAADAAWSLFPFLTGTPPVGDLLHLQRKGALLALLHADLVEWEEFEQRPTFSPVADLDGWVRRSGRLVVAGDGFADLAAFFRWFEGIDGPRARALREAWARNADELARLEFTALVETPVYYECFNNNVLFSDDTVTALLDFDSAHHDARIADIARSLLLECGPDPDRVFHWLGGYSTHVTQRLLAIELQLLPVVMVTSELWNLIVPLAEVYGTSADATALAPRMSGIRKVIDERLPALEAGAPRIRQAARQAAHPANRRAPGPSTGLPDGPVVEG